MQKSSNVFVQINGAYFTSECATHPILKTLVYCILENAGVKFEKRVKVTRKKLETNASR